jgi:hypothetical protein
MIKNRMDCYDAEERIRKRVKRWKLQDPPAYIARRIASAFNVVGSLCRPCVAASFLRTIFNGWPTSARMRFMENASAEQYCAFGCPRAHDRIEHYLVCEKAWTILSKPVPTGLGLSPCRRNLQAMFLAEKGLAEREVAAIAVACYGIARTVHACKAAQCKVDALVVLRFFLREGMRGSKALRIIRSP